MSKEAQRNKYNVLTPKEVKFFLAFSSLIVPSGEDPRSDPGASEVGTVNYIDSTLFAFPPPVQKYFKDAVALTNEISRQKFENDFADLSDANRSIILRELLLNPKTRERAFDLRSIVLEGFYSDYHDPWYRGVTPWELVRFGGKRISDVKKDWSFLKVWRDSQEGV